MLKAAKPIDFGKAVFISAYYFSNSTRKRENALDCFAPRAIGKHNLFLLELCFKTIYLII